LALKWKSVDLDRAQLAVVASIEEVGNVCREKETKSSKNRTLAMPALLVEELRRHRIAQAEELFRCGMRISGDSYIVSRADGTMMSPRALTYAVSQFMKKQGTKVRLHGLRHSHASHMLAEGVHPKVVQERLGHASIAITMDIYSHLMPNMQSDAAAKIDGGTEEQLANGSVAKW
jgi:integrase